MILKRSTVRFGNRQEEGCLKILEKEQKVNNLQNLSNLASVGIGGTDPKEVRIIKHDTDNGKGEGRN